jgi:hypothetical protein
LVPVQRLREIDEKKIQKMFFLDICTGPNTFFMDLKKLLELHLVPGTTFEKKEKKT